MIVIKKQGKKPKKYKTIYTITCPDCGCEFECELSDFKRIEKTLNGGRYIDCPCCGKEINTARLEHIETREEEVTESVPVILPFNPNLDSDSWRYSGYSDSQAPSKDPCETCPNRFGPSDGLGNPTVGDSPCEWCPHYKWKVTCNCCDTNIVNSITTATSTSFVTEDLKNVSK